MGYLIGIDGGGTKSDCVITGSSLNVLHECSGDATNFLLFGAETTAGIIFNLIDECINKIKCSYADIDAVVLGTAGAGRRSDAEKMEHAFNNLAAEKLAEIKKFHVESDALIALEGAFSGNAGSILIAGTGSIIIGKDSIGNIHRSGGFGRYIGDEGSGYSLGRKGLKAAARAFDGRGGQTMLTGILAEKCAIKSQDDLITEVYRKNFNIASAALYVLEAAEKNDPACLRIVDEETDELLLHITSMANKINEPVLPLCFSGGLLTHDNFYRDTLLKKIKDNLAYIVIKKPDHTPARGAAMLAKKIAAEK